MKHSLATVATCAVLSTLGCGGGGGGGGGGGSAGAAAGATPGPTLPMTAVSVTPLGDFPFGNVSGVAVSGDGRFVAFASDAVNLVASDMNGQVADIFLRDLHTGTTEVVSLGPMGAQANGECAAPALSADGRFVAFMSWATDLSPLDTNPEADVYVRDRVTGQVELVSDGVVRPGGGGLPAISADGRFVAFVSASVIGPAYLRDRVARTTEVVSLTDAGSVAWAEGRPALSDDGRYVAFVSADRDVVPATWQGGTAQVYVRDRHAARTELVSQRAPHPADATSHRPAMSADGRHVAFVSYAGNLDGTETSFDEDVFVHDRQLGTTRRVSAAAQGAEADQPSYFADISDDGRFVAFESAATNLVGGDANLARDLFVVDLTAQRTARVAIDGGAEGVALSGDGRVLATISPVWLPTPNGSLPQKQAFAAGNPLP